MEEYKIYCSEEQTKKALELGAPIECANIEDLVLKRYVFIGAELYALPTVEQMIGWLEEQDGIGFHIWRGIDYYGFSFWNGDIEIKYNHDFKSRKEATLAAIDAALEYIIKSR